MSNGRSVPNLAQNVAINSSALPSSSGSVLGRISQWASENKALVYTIAGIAVVVTSAGVVYYHSLTDPGKIQAPVEKIRGKKDRRKEKKKAEEEKNAKEKSVDGQFTEQMRYLGMREP
jgi:mitochondrial import receptor subunit TOM70